MRKLSYVMLLAAALFTNVRAHADTVNARLNSANPADIVVVSYTGTGGFSNVAAYAGALNWTSVGTGSTLLPQATNFSTYCIDIIHDIFLNNTYQYTVTPGLNSAASMSGTYQYGAPSQTTSKVQAIENLWNDDYSASLLSNDASAAFQVDIWKILYGSGLTVDTYGGQTGWQPLSNTWLTTLNTELVGGSHATVNGLYAMTADPVGTAQDQALFQVPPTGTIPNLGGITPLPTSVAGGIILFGLIGLAKWRGHAKQTAGLVIAV